MLQVRGGKSTTPLYFISLYFISLYFISLYFIYSTPNSTPKMLGRRSNSVKQRSPRPRENFGRRSLPKTLRVLYMPIHAKVAPTLIFSSVVEERDTSESCRFNPLR
uniref:Uncharacterized protein n=1 Tax=Picea glauca TaxID=3330 RepID=A0A101M3B0_PICGL|nr:hypothetical protein ABT39_MTgene124 [Picea glauca]